ncbi:mammalian cell entry protein [Rhodococcus sp. 05-340-1]|uniref:MCE family protein n=1 Tax=unclassified Rhodococcus (in: high G+C Gram-positive bacteria) TaxID=192944 RepID=UPI000B9B8111|nr:MULTISPECIES: MCE family protein [unclassified Rhodococcus (in: high G+C Gram-positive bacteria)]OZD69155.1 mammalian cell entry protein [Rhodococcus sp. 05-340-2]OZD73476.1 mammalian cell entry protein [Rhodococcus sp. 05-340-1]OZF34654.1 mammalian cell entry protein [Rhodococcus sp. 14-2483-1-2]
MKRGRSSRVAASLFSATVVAAMVSGCRFDGVNSIALPGNGVSGDTYEVTVELADIQNLVGNSPVKADNVVVGNIGGIASENWTAILTLDINSDVELPANVTAKLAQTSVLGSQYLELTAPVDEAPNGRLSDGDVIPLSRTSQYPSTEEVLSALSLVLNGSGLQQIQTVTTELNRVIGGRETSLRSLTNTLATFVTGLDDQRADIVAAIDGLDRLGGSLAGQSATLEAGIDSLGPAFDIVEKQRVQLTTMLTRLGDFGTAATQVLEDSRADLSANIAALEPTLAQLSASADSVPEALKIATTIPFPVMTADKALRGDYMNLFLTLDVSAETIGGKVLGSIPVDELINLNPARQAADPLLSPMVPVVAGPVVPTVDDILRQIQGGRR